MCKSNNGLLTSIHNNWTMKLNVDIVFVTVQNSFIACRKTTPYTYSRLIHSKWEIDLELNIEPEEVQQSIKLFKRTTRNMYLWDIQYKIWYERVATNSKLYQMNIKDTELCEYCHERETNVHAFVLCERTQNFWLDITLFLIRLGYRNFRLEHSILIFGDKEMDSLFNLIITIAKKVIYQKREKRNIYSMSHFDILLEQERESEEIYAIN